MTKRKAVKKTKFKNRYLIMESRITILDGSFIFLHEPSGGVVHVPVSKYRLVLERVGRKK